MKYHKSDTGESGEGGGVLLDDIDFGADVVIRRYLSV